MSYEVCCAYVDDLTWRFHSRQDHYVLSVVTWHSSSAVWGKRRGPTEGQGSPTELDLDVAVATVILPPIVSLSFSCACSFALFLSLIEALRIHAHADAVSCPQCKSVAELVSVLLPAGLRMIYSKELSSVTVSHPLLTFTENLRLCLSHLSPFSSC